MEQKLLLEFLPTFMIGKHDCSKLPAEFRVNHLTPEVAADNGTIYGQAFPEKSTGNGASVELHYYLLWRKDCGRHGHPLDTEHVAVLIHPAQSEIGTAEWNATYWYAAAHEDTVCDVSQIARASALNAEDHGATVWISSGKHAAYLDRALCRTGCGADRCAEANELVPARVINLGETGFPMNGSAFIASRAWPLEHKMSTSNFPAAGIARLDAVPNSDVSLFNPGRHPVQGIIARSSTTEEALATGGASSTAAVTIAGGSTANAVQDATGSTGAALSDAGDNTNNALQNGYMHTVRGLSTSLRHVGEALSLRRDQNHPR